MGTAIEIKTDNEGFLVDHKDWSMEFLKQVANEDGVNITMDHVDIVNGLRLYHKKYGIIPSLRGLSKVANIKIDSTYLYKLFPFGIKQAAKFAGLPKPSGCF